MEGTKGARSWEFSQVRVVEAEESWEEKGQVAGGIQWPESSPRVGVPWRSHGASGRFGRCWGVSAAYEMVVRVAECRYGTGEMVVRGALRTGFRGGSGVGEREALGWPWKRFSSWAYREVLSSEIKGARNLTGGLTEPLTSCLTGCLTVGLTE